MQYGDPKADRPLTWRLYSTDGYQRRLRPDARRVIKIPGDDERPWLGITGDIAGVRFAHHDVAQWPYTSAVTAAAAFREPDEHATFKVDFPTGNPNGEGTATCACGATWKVPDYTTAGAWWSWHRDEPLSWTRGDVESDVTVFKG